jgi:hypothetical protein
LVCVCSGHRQWLSELLSQTPSGTLSFEKVK